jgi:signal transduction histidine kinase
VGYRSTALEVEVVDDGNGDVRRQPRRAAGHGLIGMRERVALYGGRLEAGPRANGGGFRVHAEIPLA